MALPLTAVAEYPAPAEAGFHDCLLIYYSAQRDASDFRYLVADADREGNPRRWGWDAFLFLRQPAPSGGNFELGTATAADWRASLDDWFAETGDVRRLSGALAEAQKRLGPPTTPRQAIFSLHYLKRNFPFAAGQAAGESPETTTNADRAAIIERHLEDLLRRWQAADLANLKLWGFYWMSETLPEADYGLLRAVAQAVHRRGYRLLWIPYSTAQGVEAARELGVDVVILQPNYAFLSQHRGVVRYDRLLATAQRARKLGLGVEIECDYDLDTNPWARAIFLDYLALGAPSFCGYGQAPRAYFQSFDVFVRCARAKDPAARAVYDAVCDYLRNRYPPRPGSLRGARCRINGVNDGAALTDDRLAGCAGASAATVSLKGSRATLSVDLPVPRRVGQIELGVTAATPGLRVVTVRGSRQGRALSPVGWRREWFGAARERGILWVPWGEVGDHFEVTLTQFPPGRLTLDEISVVPVGAGVPAERHLARGCAYTFTPSQPRQYPDLGGRLTDGAHATRSWSEGKSVGYDGRREQIWFDFDPPRAIERVVVYCDHDPASAVYAPTLVAAEFCARSRDRFLLDQGVESADPETSPGILLPGLELPTAVALGGKYERIGAAETRPRATSGRIELRVDSPVECRQLLLTLRGRGWLMLSEIEVDAEGKNVVRGASYHVMPLPRAKRSVRYPDDGRKLTDGVVAQGLAAAEVVGWNDGRARTLTVALGRSVPVREVAAHVLGGGRNGVRLPERVVFQCSPDGRTWTTLGEKTVRDSRAGRLFSRRLAVTRSIAQPVRFVRVRFVPGAGWCLVSEIEVR